MWTVPLYLFVSALNSDSTILPSPPSSDYVQVESSPVAYIYELGDSYEPPFVPLRSYWSETRRDFQTTTRSLEELNSHGGNYTFAGDLGLILSLSSASSSLHLAESATYCPLTTSYSDSRSDALTSPLGFSDLNLLSSLGSALQVPSPSFRQGHLEGFAKRADCESCKVSLSETFPSAGGADCPLACPSPSSSCGVTRFKIGTVESEEASAFDADMQRAGEILGGFGSVTTTAKSKLHMSFNYLCCYEADEMALIKSIFDAYPWPAVTEVSFDQPVWRIDSDSASVDHYSIIVLADAKTQLSLQSLVSSFESRLLDAGLALPFPRSTQEPFHVTLGVVSGATYPAVAALAAVNEEIPEGMWAKGDSILLPPPTWG